MKIRLSQDEMLDLWRLRHALEPLRSDCVVTRADGIDLDSFLLQDIHDWYLRLLDTAPVEYLAPSDISRNVALSCDDKGVGSIILPENCRRVIELRLDCWKQPALISTDLASPIAMMQQNPYSRGNTSAPVALHSHRLLNLYSVPPDVDASITRLLCIMQPDDGFFEMDQRALSLITDKNYLNEIP